MYGRHGWCFCLDLGRVYDKLCNGKDSDDESECVDMFVVPYLADNETPRSVDFGQIFGPWLHP